MGIKLPFPLVRRAGSEAEEVDAAAVQANFDKIALEAGGAGPAGPAGPTGAPGATGAPGPAGVNGQAATIAAGTTTTGAAGTSAAVSNSGTSSAAVFDFTIPRGNTGATGSTGPAGSAATVAAGTTTTGAPGSSASVTNSGTSSAATFNFTIPRGDVGATGSTGAVGPAGTAASVAVGTVSTGSPGSSATVTNSGTTSAATLDFTIPRGDVGSTGSTGAVGPAGPSGPSGSAATINVGSVTTGAAGSSATISNTGTSSAAVFDFTIPRGDTGATGPAANLATGAPNTIQPDATGAVGTSSLAARADHTHAIVADAAGTITGSNAEGTSTSFARADHNHALGTGVVTSTNILDGTIDTGDLKDKTPAKPTLETSLPASPADGQEIYYVANAVDSIIWHFRYRAAARSGSGAWEFIGGSRLASEVFGPGTTTIGASGAFTYVNFSVARPALTVPLKGIYDVSWEVTCNTQSTYTGVTLWYVVPWNATASGAALGAAVQSVSPWSFFGQFFCHETFGRTQRWSTASAGVQLDVRVTSLSNSVSMTWDYAALSIVPQFVYA
jgi:hypothetical protein